MSHALITSNASIPAKSFYSTRRIRVLILPRTHTQTLHTTQTHSPRDFFAKKKSRMSVSFRPSQALCCLLLGSLALMLLLRSSASFLVRSSSSSSTPASAALNAARRRGGAASARALSSSSYKGRSLAASIDLDGGAVTKLDKAVDVFGEKAPKKAWDYVAHHPR